MKQVKVHGEASVWLRDLEIQEDREFRRGEGSFPVKRKVVRHERKIKR